MALWGGDLSVRSPMFNVGPSRTTGRSAPSRKYFPPGDSCDIMVQREIQSPIGTETPEGSDGPEKTMLDTPPWDWPRNAGKTLFETR